MPSVPTPIRVLLGVAVTAAEEARKLPEALPNLATTVPMVAVSTAMQASMRVQQQLATLAAKGDEVLAQLRTSDDAPPWATFDDPPTDAAETGSAAESVPTARSAAKPAAAAFDRIAFDDTGFTEGQQSDPDGWDAIGTVETTVVESTLGLDPAADPAAPSKPNKAVPDKAVPDKAVPDKAVPNKAVPRKPTAKKAAPKKATPQKASAAKAAAKPGPKQSAPKQAAADSSDLTKPAAPPKTG